MSTYADLAGTIGTGMIVAWSIVIIPSIIAHWISVVSKRK